ncbi:MAG TPA: ParB/RepB/Spo0J family partition protein, partial [Thermoguttaceae bacterium]
MATETIKRKRKVRMDFSGDGPDEKTAKPRILTETLDFLNLDPAKIDPSPFQPRRDYPKVEIEELAETIRRQGQLMPIVVRPKTGGRYELLAGERRLRAIRLIGGLLVRAECRPCGDAEARAIILTESLRREDWNAIEEARAFKMAIDTGDAAGPTELAQQLGLSQGHVSNRLRLLELPEIWQKRVISHEIPASHARSIARYKDSPAILQAIDESIKQSLEWGRSLGSAEDFDKNIDRTAWNATEPISGKRYSSKLGRQFPIFTPTDQEREKLAIIEIPRSNDKSKLEPRATNLNLWDKLQAEHEARLAAKAGSNDKIAMHEPKKPLTAAEKKKIEAARDKERARRLTKGLWELAIDWRQYLIAKDCHDRQVSQEDALRLLIWLGSSRKLFRTNTDFRQRECQFAKILKNCYEITIKYHRADYCLPEPDLFEALINVPDTSVIDLTLDYLGNLIWHPKDGPLLVMPDADVLTIADQLAIQLSAAWEKEAAGPLTERWLNLRNKEALSEMAAKAGINVKAATKAQTIEVIMKHK